MYVLLRFCMYVFLRFGSGCRIFLSDEHHNHSSLHACLLLRLRHSMSGTDTSSSISMLSVCRPSAYFSRLDQGNAYYA
jgi:hypothetical protein